MVYNENYMFQVQDEECAEVLLPEQTDESEAGGKGQTVFQFTYIKKKKKRVTKRNEERVHQLVHPDQTEE